MLFVSSTRLNYIYMKKNKKKKNNNDNNNNNKKKGVKEKSACQPISVRKNQIFIPSSFVIRQKTWRQSIFDRGENQ